MTCHRFETTNKIIVPPTEELPFYSPNDRRGVGGSIDRKLRRYSFEKSIRLSDTQLKEVLAEMATIPALSAGYCLFRPDFRERYVPAVYDGVRISDEIGNRALLDAVHRELLARVMGIHGGQQEPLPPLTTARVPTDG
ncbi:hypothetical protein KEM54_001199 [Ascosphaera aggregata]|nr:hypothetical protein KEM54_001199 [Ascosphaera aggregata]